MSDRIELRGLRLAAIVGALPEERVRAQPLEIDLDIEVDLGPAAQSDELSNTVDYGHVCELVAAAVQSLRPLLLERLAGDLASAVLAFDSRIAAVDVTVRKLRPPVPEELDSAGVRIRRVRPGS